MLVARVVRAAVGIDLSIADADGDAGVFWIGRRDADGTGGS